MSNSRIERDFLGEREIGDDCYYGIQTLRAKENFHITGVPIASEPLFIKAFGMVKKAAALTNRDCGVLSPTVCDAICYACDELIVGKHTDQFISDLIQGGAGTSTNMNVNEVIANIGLEWMGKRKGQYEFLHPNNHVNASQSTNDAWPTAFRLALYFKVEELGASMGILSAAFLRKGEAFQRVLKMGRTQLQDAVPMTLGQEFTAFGAIIANDRERLLEAQRLLTEVNMGATAIGTGVNAPPGYADKCVQYLREISGVDVTLAPNLVKATPDTGDFVQLSGILKRVATKLSKICNDLRLLASGPRAGLNEINLPALQPGSSIMPGKVNPVIPEAVNQTCFYVIGADLTVTMAAEAGQLQLNVMGPVIAFSLFRSLTFLSRACLKLQSKCVDGITANARTIYDHVMNSAGIVTLLNPLLGYETCSAIAREALLSGKSVHEIVVKERRLVTQDKWDEIYSLENLSNSAFIGE
ncbi:MAG: aspartate ammonia-lyase [Chroococcidiopsidaceae cyanobacterium CP_BM_RX_35]|nr:aspartate ammonia-lyase [Chroococcidiopsidaceae cyanobacterium CP_BM_RX_35]